MKELKVRVTIHPIDFKLLDKLNINKTSIVENKRLGSILTRLYKAGYTHVSCHSAEETYYRDTLNFHCKKPMIAPPRR